MPQCGCFKRFAGEKSINEKKGISSGAKGQLSKRAPGIDFEFTKSSRKICNAVQNLQQKRARLREQERKVVAVCFGKNLCSEVKFPA